MARKAEAHFDLAMPGFTHLQPAQPVTFGHHLLAYVEMLARDRGRFADARARLNECPLGAAALAGTSFPIDRHMTAEALGFDRPAANSLDAVADRDFALETLAAAAIAAMHLSRFAEEMVIWATPQFGFVRLSDKFTTGSSIMPQKRNPDAAELVRAKVGRIAGAFQALLIVMKGLPLAYAKDMQEDKEATFDALASLRLGLAAMTGMVEDLEPNAPAMQAAAATAIPPPPTSRTGWCAPSACRSARRTTSPAASWPRPKPRVCPWISCRSRPCRPCIRPSRPTFSRSCRSQSSVRSRSSYGGTAPQNVRKMARAWIKRLEKASGRG